ncbi:ECF sigma factor [Sulfidibacter corallicola]|uniref:RNA polymerase sigma-70 ECF-like HTH domain-containing protein n=1 Tax=Sulfidibacter corallicola TaxID=2818388 RepID=A0A8A4TGW2_SULCO|nr:ECF-type sigma factor [Sulfidibacter corallicola]QTD48873.1 hypothetical protein J3U87_25095 [Sulfidibacter corallicola]
MLPTSNPPDVDRINGLLSAWHEGDKGAYNELIELLHQDLARIAHLKFRGERVDHTLETHALVNNLYLKLFQTENVPWKDYLHFLNSAALSMNRLLIDHARSRQRKAHGSSDPIGDIPLRELGVKDHSDLADYLALGEALEQFRQMDPVAAPIADLRILGLSFEEISNHLSMEISKVKREWKLIKKFLVKRIYGKR